jgi:hypothetical protein
MMSAMVKFPLNAWSLLEGDYFMPETCWRCNSISLKYREEDTQHETQRERTQPNNPNTCVSRGPIYLTT